MKSITALRHASGCWNHMPWSAFAMMTRLRPFSGSNRSNSSLVDFREAGLFSRPAHGKQSRMGQAAGHAPFLLCGFDLGGSRFMKT